MKTRLTIAAGLLAIIALWSILAYANHIDTASVAADCSGYTIHVVGGPLDIQGAVFEVKYHIVLTPSSGPVSVVDSSFPVTGNVQEYYFDVTESHAWPGALNGAFTASGTAALYANGVVQNQINIVFTPQSLSCGVQGAPHLTIAKSPKDGTFPSGSQLTFNIVITNDGTAPATNVHFHDQLPTNGGLMWTGGVTSSVGSCSVSVSNAVDCSLGTLNPAATVTITVKSSSPTSAAACQSQPNPHAVVTADGGLQAEDFGGYSCTPPPLPCPAGSFTFRVDANGNLIIVFDQFPAPNDNSYGVNAVGWGSHGHTFSNLVGSDHAGFQLRNPQGTVVLSFNIDYISANASAPSGYASFGPFGGDGKVLIGTLTPADLSWTTSLANNLNNVNIPGLFNAAHAQQFGSVNVLVNSPPTDAQHLTYTNSDAALSGWDFHDTYFVTITAAKLASLGFNSNWTVEPNLDALHNSPAKACPPASTGGDSLSAIKTEVKDKQVKITLLNSGSVDEFVTALQLTWPTANGKLVQVKLDGDVIYDNPDIAPPAANLTVAQLVADANKRKINHNSSDVLALIFEKNADPSLANYTGTVSTSGFALSILP